MSKLDQCITIYNEILSLDSEYRENRNYLKGRLAKAVNEARFEDDYSVAEIAKTLGITRQYLNTILIGEYGIRYPEKASAAKAGHN